MGNHGNQLPRFLNRVNPDDLGMSALNCPECGEQGIEHPCPSCGYDPGDGSIYGEKPD